LPGQLAHATFFILYVVSMSAREFPEKFLVAFSLAGEQREAVRLIAEEVERQLGTATVFLDEWFKAYLSGEGGSRKLQEIYLQRSELVVVCVSSEYGDKPWTLTEYEAILSRQTELRASRDERDSHRILPIRVGEGEIRGMLFTTFIPEARGIPVAETAALIIEKLRLVVPGLATGTSSTHRSWPDEPIPFNNRLADRTLHEWPAVLQLLVAASPRQILMFHGPSGYSKSSLLGAAARYAKELQVPTVYVDFKDTMLLSEANVLREIQTGLGRILPGFAAQANPDRWKLRQALRELQDPALIILDTYEKAADTKDVREWIESQLLAEVEECPPLRFIIGGQKVPDLDKARWGDRAIVVELAGIHDEQAWKEWTKAINPGVDDETVSAFVVGYNGVPSNISSTLSTLARNLKQSA
jgi:hypothetical protein